MKNFVFIIIFFVFTQIYGSTYKTINIINEKKFKLDFQIFDKLIRIDNYYFTIGENRKILKLDKKFNIIKKVGGKGNGPGEFQMISSISKAGKEIFIYDNILKRVSVFDNNLKFVTSFYLNTYSLIVKFLKYKNDYIASGIFVEYKGNDIDYYQIMKFKKKKYEFYPIQKEFTIKKDFVKRYKKYFFVNAQELTCQKGDFIYILNSYLPYISIYNIKTNNNSKIKLDFTDYINPYKINYKKLSKNVYLRKNGLSFINEYYFTFNPIFFEYNKLKNIFIVQFLMPFQLQLKQNFKNMYLTVIFDSDFKELYHYQSNNKILQIFNDNDSLKFIEKYEFNMYKQDEKDHEINENSLLIQKILFK